MRVEAGRDQHELRAERRDGGRDGVIERVQVLVVTRAGRHRNVERRLTLLQRAAGAGIERPLVQGDEEDAVVVPEDVLRPVAVMNVEVDDRNAFDARRLFGARGDRDVVEQAEAHRAVGGRVMPGRTNQCEAVATGRLDRRAGGEQRSLVGRLGHRRIRVEPRRCVDAADERDMRLGVTAQDLVFRRCAALLPGKRGEQSGETLRTLGVVPGRVQLREPRVAEDLYCALAASRSPTWFSPHDRTSSAPPSQSGSASGMSGSGASASIAAIRR